MKAPLTAQPWFDDGLNDEEAAFVVVLSGMVGRPLYADLLAAHSTKTKTVSLPLAGDVRIWVFQDKVFGSRTEA